MDEIGNIKNTVNIKDIKSSFIIKNMFSFLSKKKLLNMVMYNQQFQKLLSVNIEKYIKTSGKYKIVGKNGKGKEYMRDPNIEFEGDYLYLKEKDIYYNYLIFEGEYINRKRNGKGREYNYNGELEFEGEYLNGERNGKGKEYYYDGKLKFEGEYLNGKRWNGKGYNKIGFAVFEIKNGNGKGNEY